VSAQLLALAVERGLQIQEEMDTLKKEYKAISALIKKAALKGPQIPLEDPERDGMQYLARGTAHEIPVIITADYLAQSFAAESDTHRKIQAAAVGNMLPHFYQPETVFNRIIEDGKRFRHEARANLGEAAEPFIAACVVRDKHGIPKNALKIEWDRAREMEVAS
jgi:hypothetical protein